MSLEIKIAFTRSDPEQYRQISLREQLFFFYPNRLSKNIDTMRWKEKLDKRFNHVNKLIFNLNVSKFFVNRRIECAKFPSRVRLRVIFFLLTAYKTRDVLQSAFNREFFWENPR